MSIRSILSNAEAFFRKREPLLFGLIACSQLIVLFVVPQIITVDGPAHAYNARLMVELWQDPTGYLAGFFSFNPISANWSSHILLSFLSHFVTMATAEKLMVGFIVLGLPYSFRFTLKSLSTPLWASYFLFPFAHSYFLYWGFYNFCIASVLLFLILGYWVRFRRDRILNYAILFVLTSLLCLSHLFIFCAFCILVFLYEISWLITLPRPIQWFSVVKRNTGHLFALSGGLAFVGQFLLFSNEKPESVKPLYDSFTELLNGFITVLPAKAMVFGFESNLWRSMNIIWILLTAWALFSLVKSMRSKPAEKKSITMYFGLFSSLVFILLYVITPKSDGYSFGFFNVRFLYFYFFLNFILLAQTETPKWIKFSAVSICVVFSWSALSRYIEAQQRYNQDLKSLYELLPSMEKDKTVYPFIQSSKRFHSHFSNFLGHQKRLVILENYEAHLAYFPLKWRKEMPQLNMSGLKFTEKCIRIPQWKQGPETAIDYVVIYNGEDPRFSEDCETLVRSHLHLGYTLIKTSKDGRAELYSLN